jgi:thiol:disulfide interchange protein DsbD
MAERLGDSAARRLGIVALLVLSAQRAPLSAQEHPITITARVDQSRVVRPGGVASVNVVARIPQGWHLYGLNEPAGGPIATAVNVGPPMLARANGSATAATQPRSAFDSNFGLVTSSYDDSATFSVPVSIMSATQPGKHELEVRVAYQTCNARYCLPPREDTLVAGIRIGGEPIPDVVATGVVPSSSEAAGSAFAALAEQRPSGFENLRLFIWLAVTMGALSLLTPCVFPMVPITISYFSTHEGSRRRALGDAAMYALGIVGAFTGLGFGVSVVFGTAALSRFAANPWLNLAVAALFATFALSLFGVITIGLPASLVSRVDALTRQNRAGRAGTTLLIGVTFAVTSFTCTAPLVGTLLVSATQGNLWWPAIGLFVFSCVFALPFLVLALVPHALSRLPRSGAWMVTLKATLGFLELGAAVKFLANADLVNGWGVFTRGVVLAIWSILAFALATYLAGVRIRRREHAISNMRYLLGAGVAAAAGVYFASGITGRRLGEAEAFLPPAGRGASGVARSHELAWRVNDYEGALAEARATGRPVLIDFTGYTCTNCRWMEANMFPRDDVRRALGEFTRVRLFTDGRTERDRQQQLFEQHVFNTVALPLYAIVDSTGRPMRTFLGMTRSTEEFIEFLRGQSADAGAAGNGRAGSTLGRPAVRADGFAAAAPRL